MNKNGIAIKGQIGWNDLSSILEGMAHNIRKGAVCLSEDGENVILHLGDQLDFEIKAEYNNEKYKLVMEVKWEYKEKPTRYKAPFSNCSEETAVASREVKALAPPAVNAPDLPSNTITPLSNTWSIKNRLPGKDAEGKKIKKKGSAGPDAPHLRSRLLALAFPACGGYPALVRPFRPLREVSCLSNASRKKKQLTPRRSALGRPASSCASWRCSLPAPR